MRDGELEGRRATLLRIELVWTGAPSRSFFFRLPLPASFGFLSRRLGAFRLPRILLGASQVKKNLPCKPGEARLSSFATFEKGCDPLLPPHVGREKPSRCAVSKSIKVLPRVNLASGCERLHAGPVPPLYFKGQSARGSASISGPIGSSRPVWARGRGTPGALGTVADSSGASPRPCPPAAEGAGLRG